MMRLVPFIAAVLFSACATPKHPYYFDHYVTQKKDVTSAPSSSEGHSPLAIGSKDLSADAGAIAADPLTLHRSPETQSHVVASNSHAPTTKLENRLKPTRKELIRAVKKFRNELRTNVRGLNAPSTANDQATQKLDNEVIVAITFGAVGITLSLLGGISAAFWIAGVLCLAAGVYFFVDWLSKR